MKPPTITTPQPGWSTETPDPPLSSATGEETTMARSLYNLIAQQQFFKGLNAQQLQLLTDSALEMQFKPEQTIFEEGSSANRFYLILEGKVVLESELADHSVVPIQTLGPGDDLGWSWLFPPYSLRLSARALEPTKTVSGQSKPARDGHLKTSHFEGRIALNAVKTAQQRDEPTQREPATFDFDTDCWWVVPTGNSLGTGSKPRDCKQVCPVG